MIPSSPVKKAAPVLLFISSIFVTMTVYTFKTTPTSTASTERQASPRGNLSLAEKLIMSTAKSSEKQMVLLMTEGRSGSSWTSELIYTHPNVFFVFEPLLSLEPNVAQQTTEVIKWSRRSPEEKITMRNVSKIEQRSLDWMESYLLCDPRKPSFWENVVFKKHGNMNSLYNCLHNKNLGGWAHLACYSDMVQACRDRDVILIKTIRFRLDWTRSLLKNYPNLKVLFLVRDPRAVLYSRSKLRAFQNFEITASMSGLDKSAAALCGNMQQNIDAFRRLDRQFPGRMKALRFEDGAMDPVGYTRDIYSFLGFTLTEDIQHHVMAITGQKGPAELGKQGPYFTSRADSKNEIQKWRSDDQLLLYPFAKKVDLICLHLYEVLGYSKIQSKDDFLSNRSLVLTPASMEDNGIF